MKPYFLTAAFLLGCLITACTQGTTAAPTTAATTQPAPATQTSLPTFTQTPVPASATPAPTATPEPSETPAPSATPTRVLPTATPTASPTPLPLSPENAAGMALKATWGLGAPGQAGFAAGDLVLVQGTPLGIYLYQAPGLELIRFLPDAGSFYLSPAGDLLFTSMADGSIQVVALPSGGLLYTLPAIAKLAPWMNAAVYEQLPKDRPALEAQFFEEVSRITDLEISPDGRLAAIGYGDATVGIWDILTGELRLHLKNDIITSVEDLLFSPNGEKLLSINWEADTAVWQVADGTLLWQLPKIGHIVGQPFSADGSHLALEISEGTSSWVAVRETRFGGEVGPQVVGKAATNAISPDNTLLATTWYGTVRLWSIPGLRQMSKIETGLDWPAASFSTDGTYVLMNGGEQAYRLSDLSLDEAYPQPTPGISPEYPSQALRAMGHLRGIAGVRYLEAGHALAWGAGVQSAWVYDLASYTVSTYEFGSPVIANVDLSFSGDRLAACTEAGLEVISLPAGVPGGEASNLGRCRESGLVRFSADGATIFRANGTLIDAVDTATGELRYNLRGHAFLVEGMEVTADGAYLVSSSNFQRTQGRELIWWRVDEPQQLRRWMVSVFPGNELLAADVLADGSIVYTALGGLRAWRLGDAELDHLDTAGYTSLALSPDDRLAAVGDFDGKIHVFDRETWQEVALLSGHVRQVTGLAFSPNGSSLLSASLDGTLRQWGLP